MAENEQHPVLWDELGAGEIARILEDRHSRGHSANSGFLDIHQWTELSGIGGISLAAGFDDAQFRLAAWGSVPPAIAFVNFETTKLPQNARSARGARLHLLRLAGPGTVGDIFAGEHIAVCTTPDAVPALEQAGGIAGGSWSPPAVSQSTYSAAATRLDAVVSVLFRVSRSEVRTAISHGFVYVGFRPVTKRSATVLPGRQIVFRTHGRAEIIAMKENPRSGRCMVTAVVFPV